MRTHGGTGSLHRKMFDFSANINPLGMPECVREAIAEAADSCMQYPDPACTKLTYALSKYEDIAPEQIVCGNGAADLIFRFAHAFQPKRAILFAPTFSEYHAALRETGCTVTEYPLDAAHAFVPDDSFPDALNPDTDVVFLCTPNNPTGRRISPALLGRIAENCSKNNTIIVCDECFLRFTENAEAYSLRRFFRENCIILNAFTKLYAMPGLRLGYALCGTAELAEKLRQSGQFWSVSVPAQAAGITALRTPDWIGKTVSLVSQERRFLTQQLRNAGIFVYDGDANFLLLKAPEDFAARMAKHHILIRTHDGFHGLSPAHFRIAVRTHAENEMLLAAVRKEYSWQKQS